MKPEFKNKEERSRGDGLRFPSSFLEGERSVKEGSGEGAKATRPRGRGAKAVRQNKAKAMEL